MADDWVCPYCELPHDASVVKSMITVTEVLDLLGVEVNLSGKFTLRDERTPSCHDFGDHYWDFGAGKGGDVIDLVQELCRADDGTTVPYNKAITMLMHKALKAGREPGDVERQQPRDLVDFSDEFEQFGGAVAEDWPGLSLPSNARADRRDGLLFIPHQRGGLVYGVKVRSRSGAKSAWPGSQFSHSLYSPTGWTSHAWLRCIIAEGESDCWALSGEFAHDRQLAVLALPSGAGTFKKHWLEDLAQFETVYLCFDNDKAGKQALDKWQSALGYLKAKPLLVPPLFNDAREAIAAGWRPELR